MADASTAHHGAPAAAHVTATPSFPEVLYSAEQIKVPAGLPEIMKLYTKAAIRAAPPKEQLVAWSAE